MNIGYLACFSMFLRSGVDQDSLGLGQETLEDWSQGWGQDRPRISRLWVVYAPIALGRIFIAAKRATSS